MTYEQQKQDAIDLWCQGKFSESDAILSSLIIDFSKEVVLFGLRASVRIANGCLEEAYEDAMHCIRTDPTWFKGYAIVSHTKEVMGCLEEALVYLDKALEMEPSLALLKKERSRLCERISDSTHHKKENNYTGLKHLACISLPPYEHVLPCVEELLKQHLNIRVQYLKKNVLANVREMLLLLYNLSQRMGEHFRIPFVMADLCSLMECRSEAFEIRRESGLKQTHSPDDQMNSLDVSFFPPRIHYVKEVVEEKISHKHWEINKFPFAKGNICKYANIPPHYSLILDHATLKGNIGLLVFSTPSQKVVRVGEASWFGMQPNSCNIIICSLNNYPYLIKSSELFADKQSSLHVCIYADDDHFTKEIRDLRKSSYCSIPVQKNTALQMYRKNLVWEIRHIYDS